MRMYDSANAFGAALDRVVDQFEADVDTVVRKSTIDLTEKIKKDTPRDTGRAAAAWILTSDRPSDKVPPEGNYNLTPPQDPGESATYLYFIVNNVEYISVLEDGHSEQAPEGMVANAFNAYTDFLNRQLDNVETIE